MRQICKLLICLCKIQTLHSSIVFKHFSHLKYGGQQIITATKLQCLYKSINNLLSEMYTQVSTNLVNKLKLYHHSTSIHNRSVLWKRNPSNIKTQTIYSTSFMQNWKEILLLQHTEIVLFWSPIHVPPIQRSDQQILQLSCQTTLVMFL